MTMGAYEVAAAGEHDGIEEGPELRLIRGTGDQRESAAVPPARMDDGFYIDEYDEGDPYARWNMGGRRYYGDPTPAVWG
jgi:hypothetical protein